MEDLDRVSETVASIAGSSGKQESAIDHIHMQVELINDSISSNVSVNQEAALASQEMKENAKLLEEEMRKFNLRQREKGRAYIPPEKSKDEEFIRMANENYQKAVIKGIE